MGAPQLSPGWVSLRQLSIEEGFSHGYLHDLFRRGRFVGVECERVGPRGWWRLKRGPLLDLALSAIRSSGYRVGFKREHDSRRERRRFLEDVCTGRRKSSPDDVAAARAVLMVGLGLAANRKRAQRFRATVAACEMVASGLAVRRSGDASVPDALAAAIAGLESNSRVPAG